MTALWIVPCVLAGLALMVLTGVLMYRYEVLVRPSTAVSMAAMSMFFFPIALPLVVMLWIAQKPERKERQEGMRRARLAALEAEVFK
jgi:hypothetical protein